MGTVEQGLPKEYVEIIPGYVMSSDEGQWILYKRKYVSPEKAKDGKGKYYWDTVGYYTSLPAVFNKVTDGELKKCKSLHEIVVRLQELHKLFEKKLK